jgi:antitoxin (DNA-binding transcriptional repressor) of toxin-antitoxin stability system
MAIRSELHMRQIDIDEAKTSLSRLADQALSGEEIVIARAGKRLVRLVPCRGRAAPTRQVSPASVRVVIGELL